MGPFNFRIQNIEYALTCRARGLQHLVKAVQPRDWLIEETEINDKAYQFANGHRRIRHHLMSSNP